MCLSVWSKAHYQLINPRRACAARVMVVGPVCVCVSVIQHLTSRMSNCYKKPTYSVAYDHRKYCGDFSETTAFKSYGMKHKRKSQYAN